MGGSSLKTLPELFNNRTFLIPDYQRGYSWGEKQWRDFWEDLKGLEPGQVHYTGMITLKRGEGHNSYYLIDGQQRLTTAIILLKVLLDEVERREGVVAVEIGGEIWERQKFQSLFLFREEDGQKRPVLELGDGLYGNYFREKILDRGGGEVDERGGATPEEVVDFYTANLQKGVKHFQREVQRLKRGGPEELIGKLVTQLKFSIFLLAPGLEEHLLFEGLNNRGKGLTTLELLKNRLLYLSLLLRERGNREKREEAEGLEREIKESWKRVYRSLGKDPRKIIGDDHFLKVHWQMFFSKKERRFKREGERGSGSYNKLREQLLEKCFTSTNFGKITPGYLKGYLADLVESAEVYSEIYTPTTPPLPPRVYHQLKRLQLVGFKSSLRPLVLAVLKRYLRGEVAEEEVVDFLKRAELFVLAAFRIAHKKSNFKEENFHEWAYYINRGEKGLKELRESKILHYPLKLEEVEGFAKKIQATKNKWKDFRGIVIYLLSEYERYLRGEEKFPFEEWGPINVEHIYPVSKSNSQREGGVGWNSCNSLGNLTLLEERENKSLRDSPFEKKRERYKEIGTYDLRNIASRERWGVEEIEERGAKILDFLFDVKLRELQQSGVDLPGKEYLNDYLSPQLRDYLKNREQRKRLYRQLLFGN